MSNETDALFHRYDDYLGKLHVFANQCQTKRRLGLLEATRASMLHLMRFYEDLCSSRMTHTERMEKLNKTLAEIRKVLTALSQKADEPTSICDPAQLETSTEKYRRTHPDQNVD